MEITRLLHAMEAGDAVAADALYDSVYGDLHALAAHQRRRWSGNDTMSTTALVHEAYLKLAQSESPSWSDRRHFFAVASRAMRQVLVDYAERSAAVKRGGGEVPLPLMEGRLADFQEGGAEDVLTLHAALTELEAEHPRWVRVVECRFFSGLSVSETAEVLDLSPATVKREWSRARAWLGARLEVDAPEVTPES
ncbi:MAG: sigma-70 family RNA polymerase sigma factor [Gemmatimonadales bacterium]|nr:MAG: sigma-70 family RNA polymerase sigma factor [Gemmatimonadales bacterium]